MPELSFVVRKGIRDEYEPVAEALAKEIAEILRRSDFTVTPNFEGIVAAMTKADDVRDDWQDNIALFVKLYLEAFVNTLKTEKFGEDEMLQEGFNEAVERGEVVFRVVDKLEEGKYNECVIEDGVLYLQVRSPLGW